MADELNISIELELDIDSTSTPLATGSDMTLVQVALFLGTSSSLVRWDITSCPLRVAIHLPEAIKFNTSIVTFGLLDGREIDCAAVALVDFL